MSSALEDTDSRPGSATSLLRTILGLHVRGDRSWIAAADLVRLLEALDVPGAQTRNALSRAKAKGLLTSVRRAGRAGYALTPLAGAMLARGDRRLFTPRAMGPGDAWCLIHWSLPDGDRARRNALRRRLRWVGSGTVGPGLAVCPDFLRDEVITIVDDLDLHDVVTLFASSEPVASGDLRTAVARWWDLDAIAALHHDFITACAGLESSAGSGPADSFAAYVRAVDRWRTIPYLDPGLSPHLLPATWPGQESVRLFAEIRAVHEDRSTAFFETTTAPPEELVTATSDDSAVAVRSDHQPDRTHRRKP